MEYCKFKNNIVRELFSTKAKFLVLVSKIYVILASDSEIA